ncbi:hypothetical protein AALP_AA1G122800 [Arabis alpina]|uniref:Uncharacterized protein n=1 Tax=Arabis alpina TaxID=50452 RepID=A0A087HMR2_ARAAL|nr:hypothetical protein AALP_AA1G122800 [Arabis alpina]
MGVWARDDSANWVFEPEIASADNFIILRTYMKYAELLARVRDKLHIRASDITVKMGYQYPAWMDIADGNSGRPEYITDDLQVENFVEMRRKIEEVNLCVTVAKQVHGIPTMVPTDQMNLQQTKAMSESDSESLGESGFMAEDEWHALALEETLPGGGTGTILEGGGEEGIVRLNSEPGGEGGIRIDCPIVTNMPPLRSRLPMKKRKLTTADMVNCSVTRPTTGIRIAEPPRSEYIRRHHPCPAGDKGKRVMHGTGDGSDSDSDDGGDGRVPTYNPPAVDGVGNSNVRRELFPANITPAELEFGIGESATNPNDDPDVGNALQKWGRFNEALQNLLSDISCDNVLFNRDAPPVFNGPELEGVDAAVEDVSYEGDKLFVGRVFPHSHHAACTVHLWRNVNVAYKSKRLAGLLSRAAKAYTLTEFNKEFLEIQRISPGCAAYLVDIAANIGVETDAMAAPEYFVETWKLGFAQNIYPVPSVGGERVGIGAGTRSDLMPPAVKRPPGRPRKIIILSRGEFKRSGKKSGRRCTRCRRQGHNKASCRHGMP